MSDNQSENRYAQLRGFLVQDPTNAALLHDAAEAALSANKAGEALELLDRLDQLRSLDEAEMNVRAIAAMRDGRLGIAAQSFEHLREAAPDDPALSFNHAWALCLDGRHEEAANALSAEAVSSLPQGAMLNVQLMHQAGHFDDAADIARQHLDAHPDYPPLLAAVSVLAMDVDDEELARSCAEAAGDHPDAFTTLGLLTLGDGKPQDARALFVRAIEAQPKSPRALIGLGLASLASGDALEAGRTIDQGAEIFGSHLGSWIASGWAYLLGGEIELARARFEHALELDPNFAENHGSLAVLDAREGRLEDAERKCEIAFRLDRQCFSASFAKVLITAGGGDEEQAGRILEMALRQPLGNSGRTLAGALAKIAT